MNLDDLLGVEVSHNRLGKGIITRVDGDKFHIQFEKEYRFPDALLSGSISIIDEELRDIIIEEIDALIDQERAGIQEETANIQHINEHVVIAPHAINNVVHEGLSYADWTRLYPCHIVLMKEQFMYKGHYESAEILNRVLNYQIYVDRFQRPTAGGPDEALIAGTLESYNVSYIIVDGGRVIDGITAENPFERFGIQMNRPW